jgi:Fanconi anemia group M protein
VLVPVKAHLLQERTANPVDVLKATGQDYANVADGRIKEKILAVSIVADLREARSNITQALQQMPNIEVQVKELSCGDYLLREDFPVERKSAVDFIASIQDRRLFEQVAKMKGDFGRATFILEGNIYDTRSNMTPEAIRGALSYLVAIEGASVLPSKNTAETAALLAVMARHLQEGLGYEVALRGGKPKDLRTQAQFIVEGFPGIGPGSAKSLLGHFGSIEAICAADVKTLRTAPGVGEKTAKQIRSIIEADYRQLTD